jgi:hypothetical protein
MRPEDRNRSPNSCHRSLVVALAVALIGCAIHDVVELGTPAVSNTGALLAVGGSGVLCARSLRHPVRAFGVDLVIAAAGTFLIGGAIASVLPLPFWPWEPEQSAAHYAVHALWAVAMVPLLVVGFRVRADTVSGRWSTSPGRVRDHR